MVMESFINKQVANIFNKQIFLLLKEIQFI